MKHRKRKKLSFIKEYPILTAIGCGLLVLLLIVLLLPSGDCEKHSLEKVYHPLPNQYEQERFYMEEGFLRYQDREHMVGIDVSEHQGAINWETVAASGAEFAILRLGYRGSTVGDLYMDEYFFENLRAAKESGLKVGVYFFSQAKDEAEAREEAEFVLAALDGQALELPIFYDWEYIGGRIESESAVPMTQCAEAFCQAVLAGGYEAGVYFNQAYGYDYLDLFALRNYTLWLAEYDTTPDFEHHFDCLQYTDSGELDGIEGNVDLDIYFP